MWLENFDGFVWLLVLVWPLLFLQRSLHREIQSVFLLLTRRLEISLTLFSLLFLPGVLLHELSHFIAAKLLGVRTGRFSLLPQVIQDGRLQLGYVETARADVLRDSLIGMAPLLTGGVCVALTGIRGLGLDSLFAALFGASGAPLGQAVRLLFARPDFWLWFYLTFVISSTMLPSASDRRAWLPVLLAFALLLLVVLLAGAGPWLVQHLAPRLNVALRGLAVIFAISTLVHILVLIPVWLLRKLLSRLTGLQVA